MKTIISCLLLVLWCLSPETASADISPAKTKVTVKTNVTDPIEILFQVALEEARRGHFNSSRKLLATLLQKSPTPRIQLELARILFLDRRYEESKALFDALLRHPELPWPVRENIQLYLDAISHALGRFDFTVSLISDSNPRNFTDSRQIKIFGQPFKILPPKDNREIMGLRYTLSAAKDLSGKGEVIGYLDTAFSDFERSLFDRWNMDAGVLLAPRNTAKLKFKAGVEESFFGGRHQYEFPYLGVVYIPDPVSQYKLQSELTLGALDVPDSGDYDATNLSLTSKAFRRFYGEMSLLWELYLEKSSADKEFYSYYGGGAGGDLGLELGRNWVLRPYLSVGRRVYEAIDPLFSKTRHDLKKVFAVTVKKKDLGLAGFVPELVVRYDDNKSNISFFSYDKLSLLLTWSKASL